MIGFSQDGELEIDGSKIGIEEMKNILRSKKKE